MMKLKSILISSIILFAISKDCFAQLGIGAAAGAAMQKAQLAKQLAVLKAIKSTLGKSKKAQEGIKNTSKENLNLQKNWFRSLEQISSGVRNYRRVKTIITRQLLIAAMQKEAMKRFIQDKNFKAVEIKAMSESYKILIQESVHILVELRLILKPRVMKMTDAERLSAIDKLDERMKDHYGLTRYYTQKMMHISKVRSENRADIATVSRLYGLQ